MMLSIFRKYSFTIIWSIVILFFSLKKIEISDIPSFFYFPHIDKVIHFLMYMLLGGVLCHEKKATSCIQWTFVFSFPIFFGTLIEFLQSLTSYRTGDLWDALANVAGSIIGILIYSIFLKSFFRY